MPMVELVPSILYYWIRIQGLNHEMMMEDRVSIEELSTKYGFTIVSPREWDFTGFVGSKCNVLRKDSGFHFTSLL